MSTSGSRGVHEAASPASWSDMPALLRSRGLRWTPQRRVLLDVLARTSGHVTGAELVERCREVDPTTIPSTVYRTLDVLEELGVVRHAHGVDGREEFHVMPAADHGHLYCTGCRATWEIGADEAAVMLATLQASRGFAVELSHLSIAGRCVHCSGGDPPD
jgi:Fur family ferric uptake transcriptional regulator